MGPLLHAPAHLAAQEVGTRRRFENGVEKIRSALQALGDELYLKVIEGDI